MENFIVSARKYRPSTFDTVVGQDAITATLKSAIEKDHLAQAFLFCGSRGVGKTSCARILAKTINCSNRKENIEACNECDSCSSFNDGASLNIHELDAASNNSVDDIRNLIDQVRFAPQIGEYKVYIIDEVHMLSQAAFNAFLKTLEEPPAHAIFILATTEKHKIIPTILSRCQIFDFKRIGVEDIAKHLSSIAEKEEIQAKDEALHLIAEKADGALRDALSIFDQLISFSGKQLDFETVLENLNILDYDYYFKATELLYSGDIPKSLLLFDEVLQKGFDARVFINGLASHLRNLLVGKDPSTFSLLEVSQSIKERYKEQSKICELLFLTEALNICRTCDVQYQMSKNKRLLVEISIMQLASISESGASQIEKKTPIIKAADSFEANGKVAAKEPQKENVRQEEPLQPEEKEDPLLEKAQIVEEQEQTSLEILQEPPPEENYSIKESKKDLKEENAPSKSPKGEGIDKKIGQFDEKKAKTSSLSISQLIRKQHQENGKETAEVYTSDSRNKFSKEEFEACWTELSKKIEIENQEGSTIVVAAMSTYEPELKEDYKVLLTVDNKSQQEEVKARRTELHDYLRKNLNNGAIELEVAVQKDQSKKKAYTDEEKFNEMAKKNPHLNTLKKEMGFDFL